MTENDRGRFATILAAICETFGVEMTEGLLEGYWLALVDLPIEAVERAAKTALPSCRFMPKPIELRERSGAVTSEERVEIAWGAVLSAIKSPGGYGTVAFDDPAITATIRAMGGWIRLAGMDGDELHKWTKRTFERTYSAYSVRGVTAEQALPLPGIHDTHNVGRGFKAQGVRLIRSGLVPAKLLDEPLARLLTEGNA